MDLFLLFYLRAVIISVSKIDCQRERSIEVTIVRTVAADIIPDSYGFVILDLLTIRFGFILTTSSGELLSSQITS